MLKILHIGHFTIRKFYTQAILHTGHFTYCRGYELSLKVDYEIRKSVVSDLGTRKDLLNFLSFYTLVIYHVNISRSNKCTSKIQNFLHTGHLHITLYVVLEDKPRNLRFFEIADFMV